jgi:hypothetical protein
MDNQCPGRESNQTPSVYPQSSEALQPELTCSVAEKRIWCMSQHQLHIYFNILLYKTTKKKSQLLLTSQEVTLDNEARKICRVEKTPASPYRA